MFAPDWDVTLAQSTMVPRILYYTDPILLIEGPRLVNVIKEQVTNVSQSMRMIYAVLTPYY